MNAEELASSIIAEARRKASAVEQQMLGELQNIERQTELTLREKRKLMNEQTLRIEEQLRRRAESRLQRESSLGLLKCKRDLIDEVFAEASGELRKLSGSARQKILKKLWDRAAQEMKIGSVDVARKDLAFVKKLAKINEITDGIGGFVVKSKDGVISMDLTFETLLVQIKELHVQEIAALLFEK